MPGNIQAWKNILRQKTNTELAHAWNRGNERLEDTPDGLLETMIALSRWIWKGGPTEAILVLTKVDGKRPAGHRLSAPTVELMAGKLANFAINIPCLPNFRS